MHHLLLHLPCISDPVSLGVRLVIYGYISIIMWYKYYSAGSVLLAKTCNMFYRIAFAWILWIVAAVHISVVISYLGEFQDYFKRSI